MHTLSLSACQAPSPACCPFWGVRRGGEGSGVSQTPGKCSQTSRWGLVVGDSHLAGGHGNWHPQEQGLWHLGFSLRPCLGSIRTPLPDQAPGTGHILPQPSSPRPLACGLFTDEKNGR